MSTRSKARARQSLGAAGVSVGKLKLASRKPMHHVDVNVSSYDRTDPFTALNTLLKLISSLPTRLGGCQYKLTSDEHKLSMHLLTIVEPFVGLSQSRRTLTRQPTELLDAIVFHVGSKRDLLSLALSCKRMHGIVFPRHFEYRHIRAKVSTLRLWNHLIVNRSLARNVRMLEIIDERATEAELLPSDILTTDTDLESTDDELGLHAKQERFLNSAITRMTTLTTFTWSCNHSPISIDNVWPNLLKCKTLKQIDVSDNLVFNAGTSEVDEAESNAAQKNRKRRHTVLSEMRAVSLNATKHMYGSTKQPSLHRVSSILNNCPNLEDLTLSYVQRRGGDYLNPVADDLLLCGRWPRLRSLSLSNLWCSPHAGLDAATTFLSSHVNLQVLHLDMPSTAGHNAFAHLVLPPDTLPRLRELRSNKEIASAVLECPCSAEGGRPLETIKGIKLSGSGWDDKFLKSLKMFGGNSVKRLDLLGWNETDDVKRLIDCVPKLVWLDIGKRFNGPTPTTVGCAQGEGSSLSRMLTAAHSTAVEWATLLSTLAELTTFHGVRLFYEVNAVDPNGPMTTSERSRLRKNEEIASTLAWKCPKLRRLDHWEEGSGKVVVLVREGQQVKYEVRKIKT